MTSADVCSCCQAAVTARTSFMSGTGTLCASCFGRWEVEQRAAQRASDEREALLLAKAARLAQLQGVNASVAIILLAGWSQMPGGLSSGLVAGVIVMAFGLRLRRIEAFWAALAVDTAGSLAFGVVSVTRLRDARLALLLFPVVFAWWLGALTWRARQAFVGPPDR